MQFNNYSPKWRWIVVDIYRAASPPLFTDTEANNCFSIYNTSLIAIPKQLLYFLMKWVSRDIFFSPGSRQEVNSTWYPEIEEPIKSREKHYSLVLYILSFDIVVLILVLMSLVKTSLSKYFKLGPQDRYQNICHRTAVSKVNYVFIQGRALRRKTWHVVKIYTRIDFYQWNQRQQLII